MDNLKETDAAKILLSPIKVTMPDGNVITVSLNQMFCYEIVKPMFFKGGHFGEIDDTSIIESLKFATQLLLFGAPTRIALPKEFKNINYFTFQEGEKKLIIIVVPLDACMKEIDCNMIGLYTEGKTKVMYTSEYYKITNSFGLCCFKDDVHMALIYHPETVEQFKKAIFEIQRK